MFGTTTGVQTGEFRAVVEDSRVRSRAPLSTVRVLSSNLDPGVLSTGTKKNDAKNEQYSPLGLFIACHGHPRDNWVSLFSLITYHFVGLYQPVEYQEMTKASKLAPRRGKSAKLVS